MVVDDVWHGMAEMARRRRRGGRVDFCVARVVVGEGVRGARRGEDGGDESPVVASVAVNARVPTTCVALDDGMIHEGRE
jgi:hypothetical protein